jgi:hypothetical protein
MTEVICWLVGVIVGAIFGAVIQSRRVIPANIDLEPPMPASTLTEARQALDQFRDKYPGAELKELGWDLINIVTDANRADIQLQQAEAAPGNAKEVREALAAVERLRTKVDTFNRRVAQMRTGSWPDD